IDGELRLAQELEVQPGGLRTRVRGLQSHKKKLESVPAGTRTAVNVGGLAVEDLRRGQVLALPGAFRPTRALDARLRLIEDARPRRSSASSSAPASRSTATRLCGGRACPPTARAPRYCGWSSRARRWRSTRPTGPSSSTAAPSWSRRGGGRS